METATYDAQEVGFQDGEHHFKMRIIYNSMPCFEKKQRLYAWALNRSLITIDYHKVHHNGDRDSFNTISLDRDAYIWGFISKFESMYWYKMKTIEFEVELSYKKYFLYVELE